MPDVSGILDGECQRISEMKAQKAEQLIKQGIITDSMIVKINAVLDAIHKLGRPLRQLALREQLPALFNSVAIGTRIIDLILGASSRFGCRPA